MDIVNRDMTLCTYFIVPNNDNSVSLLSFACPNGLTADLYNETILPSNRVHRQTLIIPFLMLRRLITCYIIVRVVYIFFLWSILLMKHEKLFLYLFEIFLKPYYFSYIMIKHFLWYIKIVYNLTLLVLHN